MKKCPWCGKEHPDETSACAVDGQPLRQVGAGGAIEAEPPRPLSAAEARRAAARRQLLVGGLWCGGFILVVVLQLIMGSRPVGALGILTAALAARKGYRFYYWLFAGGLVGLIVLAFLPFANKEKQSPEESARLLERGNRVGWWLSVGTIFLGTTIVVLDYCHDQGYWPFSERFSERF